MTHNNIEFISVESALQLYQGRHIDNDLLLIDEVADLPLPNESRRMKSLLLALCIRGEAQYTVDTIEHKVKPNDIMIISNGQVVDDYLLSPDCSGIAIMVSYDFYREIVSDVHELSSLFIFSRNHPVVTLSEDEARMIQEYYQLLKNKVEIENYIVKIKENNNYKNFVSKNSDFTDLRKFKFEDWGFIISENLKRCLFLFEITNINYEIYSNMINQESIFNKQLDKYISQEEKVLVLSAFPFFLIEYFGEEFFSLVVS